MPEMIPVRVRRVVDGVLYDSGEATIIHHWDETIFVTPYRMVLAKTPCGRYFLTTLCDGSILRPGPIVHVYPYDRFSCITALTAAGAPESVLEGFGVNIMTPAHPDQPFHLPDTETVLARKKWLGWQALVKSDGGRFWIVRWLRIFGRRRLKARPVSHYKAINWAVMNGLWAFSDRLGMVGIQDSME